MKKRKIAIPVNGEGILESHFGHSKYFAFCMIEDGYLTATVQSEPPRHEPGVLPRWLAQQNVTDVITGGLGQKAIALLKSGGVNVYTGAPPIFYQEIIELFLQNRLEFSNNYCDH
ncbi:NifB/NifX family molybdenum-iron cluster-binding protein [Marinilabiliaceae bacterium ANBcel2]|nr:NifB/NifX family molybdenum-iron cluster-binding protein [Marinilabiliaceae bacterium ANBcel2]